MRSGLFVAIILGGIISMAVMIAGTAVKGSFSFDALAGSLGDVLGGAGPWILAFGLFAAGFTSAVTAPLASAVTMQSLYGAKRPGSWANHSSRFRFTWIVVLATGMGFGMAGFKPVPAIILAQAMNGLILPVIGVFLLLAVNHPGLMKKRVNGLPGNILMLTVVCIAILLGLLNLTRSIVSVIKPDMLNWGRLVLADAVLALIITMISGHRAIRLHKRRDISDG
jgi:Mn2+/Fe2+ NRAMP family transporter